MKKLVLVLGGTAFAGIAWWLGSPLIVDRTVDEAFPLSAGASVPEGLTQAEVEAVMVGMSMVGETVTEPMLVEAEPVAVKRGSFRDADSFHRGSGEASIYALPDGSLLLRLASFEVTNGPDLRVLLSAHPSPASRDDLEGAGYVEVAKLKGNIGDQNYTIDSSEAIEGQRSVVIYCKPFHVVFSVAELNDVIQ